MDKKKKGCPVAHYKGIHPSSFSRLKHVAVFLWALEAFWIVILILDIWGFWDLLNWIPTLRSTRDINFVVYDSTGGQ